MAAQNEKLRVGVVGGVAGGASAAARVKRLNENADVVVFEKGSDVSFSNCGHDYDALIAAFEAAAACKGKPTVLIAKTTKGKGVSFMENNAGWHGKAPNDEQYAQAKAEVEAKLAELEGK